MRIVRFWFGHAIMLLLACALLGGCIDQDFLHLRGGNSGAEADAEQWYAHGEFDRAGQAFMELADSDSNRSDHYRLRAAEAYREAGNFNAVAWALQDVDAQHLNGNEGARVDMLDAEVALSHRDANRALNLLTFPEQSLAPALRIRALELRARAQAAGGDAFASARTRAALDALLPANDRAQNEAEIFKALARVDVSTLQQQAASLMSGDPVRPFIERALGQQGQAFGQNLPTPGIPIGALSGGTPTEGYHGAKSIALLLPVEGALKAAAQPVRDGFFAAYFTDAHTPRPDVRVYDAGNTAQDAVAAYQRAVSEGADRVVGPLRRDAVSAVFALAAQNALPVPVLALNQPEGGDIPPVGSAAFGLMPDSEGAQAAQHMIDRGITHVAIITSGDDWATRAAAAFRAQFENAHGTVIGDARLREGEVNASTAIHQALASLPSATPPTTPGAPQGSVPALAAPTTDTGIFISMRPQQARLLLPQLRIAGYSALPVFATSHVFGGISNPGTDRDLDGLEFCDSPWLFNAVVGLPNYSDIANSLESARGAGGRLFAFGFDAYALVPYLDWMAQHRDSYLPGATGQLSSDGAGRIQRQMTWAHFVDGVPQPVGGLQMSAVTTH